MIENPSGDPLFDDYCSGSILVFVDSRFGLSLYFQQSTNDWRPTKMCYVAQVKYIVESVVVRLIAVIGKTIANENSIEPYNYLARGLPTALHEINLNIPSQFLKSIKVFIDKTH